MKELSVLEVKKRHRYYNNAFFAKWAKLYDYEKYLLFPLRRRAAKYFGLSFGDKVLDVATGTGAQAYEFAKRGYDVTGIDLSPEMLEQARKKISRKLKLKFEQADGMDLPFKEGVFDSSSISLGLHDMPLDVGKRVLKEMKRVTKKDGKIMIVDYNEPKKHLISKLTFRFIRAYETKNYVPFIRKGLDKILEEVGLNKIRETNFLGLSQIVVVENN